MFIVEYYVKDKKEAVKSFTYRVSVSVPRAGDTVCLDGVFYIVGKAMWVYYSDNMVRVAIKIYKEV